MNRATPVACSTQGAAGSARGVQRRAVALAVLALAVGPGSAASTGADVEHPYPARPLDYGPVVAMVSADFDGDGIGDIASVANGRSVEVALGRGDASFAPAVSFALEGFAEALTTADLDRDGNPDLAVATVQASTGTTATDVVVLLGRGAGDFAPPVLYAGGVVAQHPCAIAAGDLNEDGLPDLVSTCGPEPFALLNQGDGTFVTGASIPGVGARAFVQIGDVDGDGVADVVTYDLTNDLQVASGRGDGSFEEVVPVSDFFARAESLQLADVDGDGVLDILTAEGPFYLTQGVLPAIPGVGRVCISSLEGDGSLRSSCRFWEGARGQLKRPYDLDGDGLLDLVMTSGRENRVVSVQRGLGGGEFAPPELFQRGNALGPSVLLEADGDGVLDLVVHTAATGRIQVLRGVRPGLLEAASWSSVSINAFRFTRHVRGGKLADFDGDGVLDLYLYYDFGNPCCGNVGVALGRGDGRFEEVVHRPLLEVPRDVVAGDFDGDGNLDLAAIGDTGQGGPNPAGALSLLTGRGDGTFDLQLPTVALESGRLRSGIAEDLDLDGALDLAVVDTQQLIVLWGEPGQLLDLEQEPTSYPLDGFLRASRLVAGDVDEDGRPDLVVGVDGPPGLQVFASEPGRVFQPSPPVPLGVTPNEIALGDLDGDSHLDAAVVDFAGNDPGALVTLKGRGTGDFEVVAAYTVWTSTRGLAVEDVDLDGHLDVLIHGDSPDAESAAAVPSDLVSWFRGLGDATLAAPQFYGVCEVTNSSTSSSMDVGDLNGDGLLDVVVVRAEHSSGTASVLLHRPMDRIEAEVDVEPFRRLPVVRPGARGVIPVAVFGSEALAAREIDLGSLAFGPSGAPSLLRKRGVLVDLNRDGFRDLLTFFRNRETGIEAGDREACATGETSSGVHFRGCDPILTIPACGLGAELPLALAPLVGLYARRRRVKSKR